MKTIQLLFVVGITGSLIGSPFVNNPRKVAQEQATQAFKAAGVQTRGIVGNVNEVQDAVGRIKKGMDEVQRAIYAPRSPFSRLKRIANDLEQFQKNVPVVEKIIPAADLQRLLGSANGTDELLKKITNAQQKSLVRLLSSSYDALLFEMDTVVIHAMLHHTRQTLYNVAGMLDSVVHIRDYAGNFSNDVLSMELMQKMREVSGAIRAVARKLNEIMQGGSRSLRSDREQFVADLLKNREKISIALGAMQESSSAINAAVQKIQSDLTRMTKAKNSFVRAATMMQKRLAQSLLKARKGNAGQDISSLASAEIQKMMEGLHSPIVAVLTLSADVLEQAVLSTQEGITGINSFKIYIGFDVVNPVVRLDLDALPKLTRELSRTITQLREKLA